MRCRSLAWIVVGALAGAGCATAKLGTPEEYFADAQRLYRIGAYPLAIDRFQQLLDQHPFSDYTEEAELRMAHAHYLNGEYIEAIAALTDFQRRHPTSPSLGFVGYTLGMCYKRQMGAIDRDQSAARNAEAYFAAVIQQHPRSFFAELAREELADCRESLAAHELYVADFYRRRKNRRAAEHRELQVVGRYPSTTLSAEALYRLARMYEQTDRERAALAYAAVASQYPNSNRVAAARAALANLGASESTAGTDPRAALLALSGFKSAPMGSGAAVEVAGIASRNGSSMPAPPAIAVPGVPVGRTGPY